MGFFTIRIIEYLLDPAHGFGLKCSVPGKPEEFQSFYEDGTLQAYRDDAYDSAICALLRYESWGWARYSNKQSEELNRLVQAGQCDFLPFPEGEILIRFPSEKPETVVKVQHGRYRYDVECSCKQRTCVHIGAAAQICRRRLNALKHAYVLSDLHVDKGLFLDPLVEKAIDDGILNDFGEEALRKLHELMDQVDAAKSPEYYRLFHNYILNLSPAYDEYDSHYLEEYEYLLYAMFEDRGYQEAVLDRGDYADPENYEGRQHRSNRAVFKRLLKEYRKAVKELEGKNNFEDNPVKEFLLKYRGDLRGLTEYFATGLAEDHGRGKDCGYTGSGIKSPRWRTKAFRDTCSSSSISIRSARSRSSRW